MRGPLLASQQWGGERSFADATANGKGAPKPSSVETCTLSACQGLSVAAHKTRVHRAAAPGRYAQGDIK